MPSRARRLTMRGAVRGCASGSKCETFAPHCNGTTRSRTASGTVVASGVTIASAQRHCCVAQRRIGRPVRRSSVSLRLPGGSVTGAFTSRSEGMLTCCAASIPSPGEGVEPLHHDIRAELRHHAAHGGSHQPRGGARRRYGRDVCVQTVCRLRVFAPPDHP